MGDPAYLKCIACGYEFLSTQTEPHCPRCERKKTVEKDIRAVAGLDE